MSCPLSLSYNSHLLFSICCLPSPDPFPHLTVLVFHQTFKIIIIIILFQDYGLTVCLTVIFKFKFFKFPFDYFFIVNIQVNGLKC